MVELANSLYFLDQAKWKWAEENHKSDQEVPTMEDLSPYLADWTNSIRQLVELGINYTITPNSENEPQSDTATLTRALHFQKGFCRYYPAGTRYGLQSGWAHPELDMSSSFLAFYFNNRELLAGALLVLATGNLIVFMIKWKRIQKRANSNCT